MMINMDEEAYRNTTKFSFRGRCEGFLCEDEDGLQEFQSLRTGGN